MPPAAPTQDHSSALLAPALIALGFAAPLIGAAYAAAHSISPASAWVSGALYSLTLALPAIGYGVGRAPLWWACRVPFWAWDPDRIMLTIATTLTGLLTVALGLHAARKPPNPNTALAPLYDSPFLGVALAALGTCAAVWLFLIGRLRLRHLARDRLLPDETMTSRVVRAIRAAEAVTATQRVGVDLDHRRGMPQTTDSSTCSPHTVGDGEHAFGAINRDTLLTRDRHRILNGWTDPANNWMILPHSAGAVRVLVIAGSGSGKTVLLFSILHCAGAAQWPALFVDLKGDPKDAANLVTETHRRYRGRARTLNGVGFRFFDVPDKAALRARLLALFPDASSDAASYYEGRRLEILTYLLDDRLPMEIRSIADLDMLFRTPDLAVDADAAKRAMSKPTKTGSTDGEEVRLEIVGALRRISHHLCTDVEGGWSFTSIAARREVAALRLFPATSDNDKLFAQLLLVCQRQYMEHRMQQGISDPFLMAIDEFPQMIGAEGGDAATIAAALYETARSAGMGLILAGQSIAGFSNDPNTQTRLLTAGQATIVGRTVDPEPIVKLAGTLQHLESSADPTGGLKSSRSQHTYRIHPDDVREVELGGFWIIADGTTRRFNALP